MSQFSCMTLRNIQGRKLSLTEYQHNREICDKYKNKETQCLNDENALKYCIWIDKRQNALYNVPWIKSITNLKINPLKVKDANQFRKKITTLPKEWNSVKSKQDIPTIITVKAIHT